MKNLRHSFFDLFIQNFLPFIQYQRGKKTFNFQRAENFPFRSQSTAHSHDEYLEANEEIYE